MKQRSHECGARGLCSRRHWFQSSAFGLGSVAAAMLLGEDGLWAQDDDGRLKKPLLETPVYDLLPKQPPRPARAKAMISMFMMGGPSQMDLFDPKPELVKRHGQQFTGDISFDNAAQASRQIMGPQWEFQPRGKCGMEISSLLPHLAEIADEITLIRSMHSAVNNHFPGFFAMNTGGILGGRATLGSWLTYALGSESQDLPAYVALTHPAGLPICGGDSWTNGGLPSLYQGTVVRPTEPRMFNLNPPPHLRGSAQAQQLEFLSELNRQHAERFPGNHDLTARMASYQLAARMQLSAGEAFDISSETAETLEMYGVNNDTTRDYGTRCLIARRLVERGVRFVQIFNNGQSWDHHSAIATELPNRCREIDQPAAALVKDLKQRGLLDSTLVHWGGEMGRLPTIQVPVGDTELKHVGRDHNTYGFSMWVAGAGIKSGYVHGATDDFSHYAVQDIVTHHDWLTTVLDRFGLDAQALKFEVGGQKLAMVENPSAKVISGILG
ncbi:MAG: DUF1501 domain-containing protein [Planctomycetaceae bacterium]|nr:DUF1501 domain-containing protein [Planctomycetaceae bacterium]